MAYHPIDSYGLIGNCRTVALVGMHGSIDWMCLPFVDSPSVFGALLDDTKGGRFSLHPVNGHHTTKQLYWPDSNVLVTRFLSEDGVGEIEDFMPLDVPGDVAWNSVLVRRVRVSRGRFRFVVECRPAFDYARASHTTLISPHGAVFRSDILALGLTCDVPLNAHGGGVTAEFELHEGQGTVFVLRRVEPHAGAPRPLDTNETSAWFASTIDYWRRWIAACTYRGRWREMVRRSALVMKLLTFEPTGALVAAATTSLPEHIGGRRNWDYRYSWIRDASFTLYAFIRIGLYSEAKAFMRWIGERLATSNPKHTLQTMYGIDGRTDLAEVTLDHLDGYRGSKPVRIGNGAANQLQLDIYGELMDTVYLYNKYVAPIGYDYWIDVREMAEWVAGNWDTPDDGIWEVRSGRTHFTYSKVMCWVAMDRALRLADKRSLPAPRSAWLAARDRIYESVMTNGYDRDAGAFVQAYDVHALDASTLVMPMVFFIAPSDPRMLSTIDRINRAPEAGGLVSDGLVYRYHAEKTKHGSREPEGTFTMCTFWLVEALTRAGRTDSARLNQALLLFERMLGYANHLGLYSEQIGRAGQALGNFPQAFTHLALISAAFNLDRALDSAKSGT